MCVNRERLTVALDSLCKWAWDQIHEQAGNLAYFPDFFVSVEHWTNDDASSTAEYYIIVARIRWNEIQFQQSETGRDPIRMRRPNTTVARAVNNQFSDKQQSAHSAPFPDMPELSRESTASADQRGNPMCLQHFIGLCR